MTGPAQSLFVPLSLAVGFSMGASYLLSSSLVPVLSNWILKQEKTEAEHAKEHAKEERFDRFRRRFQSALERIMKFPKLLLGAYAVIAVLIIVLLGPRLAQEIFPSSASTQVRLRIDAPDGTRVAVTEALVQKVLAAITREAGAGNLDRTLGYIGTQPSSYPINTVFLWTSGPQQAIMNVGLNPEAKISLRSLEENLRQKLPQEFPGTHFSFDPGDLISQTLNFGSPSSAEVAITGPQYGDVQSYANRVQQELAKVKELRDVEFEEPLRYPTVNVHVDRVLAGQVGATASDVGSAVVSSTASSRFVAPNYWRDPKSGVSYQVQVQVPQPAMTSLKDIQTIPVNSSTGSHPLLSQVADVQSTTVPGELDRQNGMWMIIASANVGNNDFARAAKEIDHAIAKAGQAPRGVTTQVRGQVNALKEIFSELAVGLALAVVVILLLLTANFQSLRLALIVISSVPAVLVGAILMLLLTGTTLNLESFMGTIMAIGVAVANAILLVTFAEQNRRNGADPVSAARSAAAERLRPVLMTSLAMIAGMIPMALAIGQGSEETAPLGRAVIGGLFAATLATLFLLPTVFGIVQKRASLKSPSLDPEDADSPFALNPEKA
jgi:multidrug efflux pump subunit AcrB